ncbi:MAG: fibronectin type III domain-containing protein, partial [Bacteroidia bacterium]|nr:fibronectin type III domain-containing protein [Bacteroidia bacterium]
MKLFFIHVKWAVLAFLLLAVMPHAIAQNYPVQATVALNPPYSPRLPTLGTEAQALTIQLLHKDFATPATSVYLQFKLEGAGITIETVSTYKSPAAFALTAGIPQSVSGTDIADLFDANNLNFLGIAKNAYLSGGQKIPQGIYRFSFRALDQSTGLPVSNWGSFSTSIFGQRPPIINTPADGSEQTAQDPQFLNIQFTPRHTNYPALLGNVRYKIRLIELQPANRNANEAMQSVQVPLFETITDQTFYHYGASEPQLVFGRSYALMVQVLDATGAEQFENNGNSQVVAFVYGSKCPSPTGLVANPQAGAGATLSWDAQDMHRAYGVSYRKKGSWAWQEQMVFGTGFTISNLQPASIYEFKVWGICAES